MRIEQSNIYEFKFSYYGGELSIPVRAATKEEAAEALKLQLSNFQMELAMEFPKETPGAAVIPSGVLGDRPSLPMHSLEIIIEEKMKELGEMGHKSEGTVAKTIKKWTGFPYEPQNYHAIIDELERMKHGKN